MTDDGTDYVDEKIKELEAQIDKIELEARLSYVIGGKEVDDILLYSNEQLEKLTAEECDICSFLCLQYVVELQKRLNRCRAIKNWIEKTMDLVIGKEYSSFYQPYYPVEVIKSSIISNNSYAKRLFDIRKEKETEIDSLHDFTKHVTQMSQTLKNMAFNKKAESVTFREN